MSTADPDLRSLLPKTHCPFNWKSVRLTSSLWQNEQHYDLSSDLGFEKAVAVLSEDMSFCDKITLAKTVAGLSHQSFNQDVFYKEAGYTRLKLIEQISSLTEILPLSFVTWCSTKKLNAKDFRAFLNDYAQLDQPFFDKIAELDPTKNTGLQLIELYFDLKAQGKIQLEEVVKFKNAENLFSSMKKKRFSKALSKDNAVADELSKMQLASGVKVSLKRNGDKRVLKMELEADSPDQLKDKLEKCISKTESFKKAWNTEVK